MILVISFILFGLVGAIASRIDGGGFFKGPEWLDKILVTFPYAIIGGLLWWPLSIPCMAGAWLGRATGLGQYFLEMSVEAIKPEKVDFLIHWIMPDDPRCSAKFANLRGIDKDKLEVADRIKIRNAMEEYGMDRLFWRCVLGMSLTGLVVTIVPAVLLACYGHVLLSGMMVVSGLLKGTAYALNRDDTRVGEYSNGFQQFFFAGIVIWGIIGG